MRALSHLSLPHRTLGRHFPAHALTAIEHAIVASERQHRAEIRVAIEVGLDLRTRWRVRTPHNRAVEMFDELRLGVTRERNAVLIYVLLAKHKAEVVADRGFDGRIDAGEWQRVATLIEREFAAGNWRDGVLRGIEAMTVLLIREFPVGDPNPNECLDRPAVL
jgi:uncharacterized membrane protein